MNTAIHTLKNIALNNKRKLSATFGLVALENMLFLLYPLVGSFAVNAVLNQQTWHALVYALMVFVIWSVGSARRAVDTRAFVKIYADLASKAIISEKQKGNTSATAHAVMARQFVAFFEEHLPILITALFNIIGSVVMLLMLEFYSGMIALFILFVFILILPNYSRQNDKLYFKLNNRLENEVNVIEQNKHHHLIKHYDVLSKIRIAISNREAFSYLMIGLTLAILFGATLFILSKKSVQAGHIYAVMTYLWGFAMSLDDMPRLVEKFSELKDIGQRVAV
ncbi:ABC transporter six-transmembrane domain-containing protein [Moraxella nasicaprae]|uniref:ABC transporter six-transmembrane domain-containing protein n=1 Tax=Moraxella nasicaprae TaxID=2904122 RepID=A0ABY6F5K5_9GAMM|nr:ABC transporter six-transmembrane domain-containing protein [Moraxella nasicaprae]UXZ05371.1 ABC transporter six-transmembrane domain-containing protein [Moraxella nasicaprae]